MAVQRRFATWKARVFLVTTWVLSAPVIKQFKPKVDLVELESYTDKFWSSFPVNKSEWKKSLIDHGKLWNLAMAAGIQEDRAREVCENIQRGAEIGCKGPARQLPAAKIHPQHISMGGR